MVSQVLLVFLAANVISASFLPGFPYGGLNLLNRGHLPSIYNGPFSHIYDANKAAAQDPLSALKSVSKDGFDLLGAGYGTIYNPYNPYRSPFGYDPTKAAAQDPLSALKSAKDGFDLLGAGYGSIYNPYNPYRSPFGYDPTKAAAAQDPLSALKSASKDGFDLFGAGYGSIYNPYNPYRSPFGYDPTKAAAADPASIAIQQLIKASALNPTAADPLVQAIQNLVRADPSAASALQNQQALRQVIQAAVTAADPLAAVKGLAPSALTSAKDSFGFLGGLGSYGSYGLPPYYGGLSIYDQNKAADPIQQLIKADPASLNPAATKDSFGLFGLHGFGSPLGFPSLGSSFGKLHKASPRILRRSSLGRRHRGIRADRVEGAKSATADDISGVKKVRSPQI